MNTNIYGMPYMPPIMPPMPNMTMMPTKVPVLAGREGVDKLNLPPDTSIIAVDANADIVWYIETDSAGAKKTVQPFTVTPYQEEKPEDLTTRLARIEERMARYESNIGNDGAGEPNHADD